jgi:hypothetical protein
VEIGWRGDGGVGRRLDGKQGMWLSNLYYSLSQALEVSFARLVVVMVMVSTRDPH